MLSGDVGLQWVSVSLYLIRFESQEEFECSCLPPPKVEIPALGRWGMKGGMM